MIIAYNGLSLPSTETPTNWAVHEASKAEYVTHIHLPPLWICAHDLGLPETSKQAAAGSPDMMYEVERLFLKTDVAERRMFSMGGHENGLVAFADTQQELMGIIMSYAHKAKAIERSGA